MRTILYVIYCLDFIRFSRSIKVGTKDDASFTEYEWKINGTCEFCEIPQLLREGLKKVCKITHLGGLVGGSGVGQITQKKQKKTCL